MDFRISQYPGNHPHRMQYQKFKKNMVIMTQLGLKLYNPRLIYRNDLEHTVSRLNALKSIKTTNRVKRRSLIISGLLFILFLGSIGTFFIFSSKEWFVARIVIASILLFLTLSFLVDACVWSKQSYRQYLRNRRATIRNYLRVENQRYYHRRRMHWKPSPECSYLTLRETRDSGVEEEEEVWLTGRERPDVLSWG